MNTLRKTVSKPVLSTSIAARLGLAAILAASAGGRSHAGSVVFGPATTIAGDADVMIVGQSVWGYNLSGAAVTLNGVTFTGAGATDLGTDVILAGIAPTTLGYHATAFGTGVGGPYAALTTNYKNLLKGARYTNGAGSMSLTLNNLIAGHSYAAQIWSHDNRALAATRNTNVIGGNTVLLDYNNTGADGGVGQYSVGLFRADAATQAFSLSSATSGQFNAIQLRDVTNIGFWTGTAGGALDATTANFADNLFSAALSPVTLAVARAPLGAATFGDSYWDNGVEVAVTQTALTVAAGGLVGGNLSFQNSALSYTINSADAVGLTGATNLTVAGGGTVTLNGTHTIAGATSVGNGTLKVGSSTTFTGTGTLTVNGTGVFDLNGSNATFAGAPGGTGTITDGAAGAGTSTLGFLLAPGAVGARITDGATRSVALRITNNNGNFFLNNAGNTFSGGITLRHSATGTRMSPGTIVAGAYGTGPITVGEAPTDRAGIFFAAANQTVTNDVIANTGLGTDRVGTFRIDVANITFSGQLTANLEDVTFSTNGNGSANVTGKVTGPKGLKLRSHTLGGTSFTATLNTVAGTNDYAGDTTINDSPQNARSYTLSLGAAEQIPNGAGKGNVIINTNGTGVGRLNLNGFSETINGLSGSGTVDGVSGTPVFTVGGGDASGGFTGTITGPLSLTKEGAGTQSLGTNSYTGATSVNGGKLFVNGSLAAASAVSVASGATFGGSGVVNGPVTVGNGGAIESGNGSAAGTLTVASLTLGSAGGDLSALNLRPFGSPAINVTGTDALLMNGGAGTVTVNILGAAPAVGVYTLIDYAGAPVAFGSFATGTLPNRVTANLVDNPGNTSIDLDVMGVDTARWSGALGSEWSTATLGAPKNWVLNSNGTTQTDYLEGDTVSFTDSATTTAVNIPTVNVAPAGVLFDHSAKDYTLTGGAGITGATALTKRGTGTLTISNTNSFSGSVAVEQGTVSVAAVGNGGANSALGSNSAVILGDGINRGTLAYTGGGETTNRAFTLNAGGGEIDVTTAGATLGVTGVLSGAGLTKTGAGALALNAANTFTGGLTISEGILVAGNAAALGNAAGLVSVESGATLDINAQALQGYTQNISIAGAGAVPTLGALGNSSVTANLNAIRGITLTADASIGGNNPDQIGRWDIGRIDFNVDPANTVNHIDGGGFVLTKVGSGYIGLLTGAVNLAGFVVDGGTIAPHENTSFGAGPVTVNNGSNVRPWGTNITFANNFTINSGTLQNDGHTNNYNGTMTIAGPTTINAIAGGNIVFNGNATGAGDITKVGPFSYFLSGDNSGYTGTLTNNESNTFFNSATAGSAAADFVVNAGNLANTTVGDVTIELGSLAGTGGQFGNNVAGGNVTFEIGGNGASTAYSGNIVDSVGGGGTTALHKVGAGTLALGGTNSYTGATIIDDGTLVVSGSLAASPVTVNVGGALGGTGSLGGALNILGTVAPGASIGTLASGTATFQSGAVFDLEINTTLQLADVLAITGDLNLADDDGTLLTITDLSPLLGAPGPIPFITYSGAWDGDLFNYGGSPIPDDGSIIIGGNTFTLDYNFSGNSVALVPEPTAMLSILGGLGVLLARRRRA